MYRLETLKEAARQSIQERKVPTRGHRIQAERRCVPHLRHWKAQLDKLTDMIERKLEDSDYSAIELAATFLKMQMGEEPQENPGGNPPKDAGITAAAVISAAAVRTGTIVPEKTDVEIIPVTAGMTAKRRSFPDDKGRNAANTAIRHPARPAGAGRTTVPPP